MSIITSIIIDMHKPSQASTMGLLSRKDEARQWLLVRQEVFDIWPYRQETNSYPVRPTLTLTATLGLNQLVRVKCRTNSHFDYKQTKASEFRLHSSL